ncbi:MAG: DUF3426 domain-containing protein [Burkholderiaceae bacterium]
MLTLALLAQATVWHFDRVINHMPILVPVLQNACQLFGCDAPTPSAVGRVGITQSSLVRTTPTEFRLDIELINRANFAVHTPVAQVTLLDMDERVLVRRLWVLLPIRRASLLLMTLRTSVGSANLSQACSSTCCRART